MDRRPAEIWAVAVFQGRNQFSEVQLLVDPDQQVIGIKKSLNCLEVNWNRVESLRWRSRSSIIGGLSSIERSRHHSPTPLYAQHPPDFFNRPLPSPFTMQECQWTSNMWLTWKDEFRNSCQRFLLQARVIFSFANCF